jgi:hypothetical protein
MAFINYPSVTVSKKKKFKLKEVRSLTIQPQNRINPKSQTIVPEIRLRGNWLEELGFIPHQKVNITTGQRILIIRVEE